MRSDTSWESARKQQGTERPRDRGKEKERERARFPPRNCVTRIGVNMRRNGINIKMQKLRTLNGPKKKKEKKDKTKKKKKKTTKHPKEAKPPK